MSIPKILQILLWIEAVTDPGFGGDEARLSGVGLEFLFYDINAMGETPDRVKD